MDLPAGIPTLQRTDRWVGGPLCAILTLLRKIFESAGQPGPRQFQRILFVKFAEQGSTVLAYPAILRAIEMVGRENVYFVVFEDNRFILDAMEIIPCVNAYNNRQSICRNNLCMQAITVDDVFKEVTRIYDSLKTTTSGN